VGSKANLTGGYPICSVEGRGLSTLVAIGPRAVHQKKKEFGRVRILSGGEEGTEKQRPNSKKPSRGNPFQASIKKGEEKFINTWTNGVNSWLWRKETTQTKGGRKGKNLLPVQRKGVTFRRRMGVVYIENCETPSRGWHRGRSKKRSHYWVRRDPLALGNSGGGKKK